MIFLHILQFLQCIPFLLNDVPIDTLCFDFGEEFIDSLGQTIGALISTMTRIYSVERGQFHVQFRLELLK